MDKFANYEKSIGTIRVFASFVLDFYTLVYNPAWLWIFTLVFLLPRCWLCLARSWRHALGSEAFKLHER